MIQNGHFCCSTTVRMYGTSYVGSRQQGISLVFWNTSTVCIVSCCTFSLTVSGVCFTDIQACLSWLVIVNQFKAPSLIDIFSFMFVILVIGDSEIQQHGMRELHQLFISCRPFDSGQKSISSRFMTEVFCKPNRQMIGKPISFVLERESLIILWWFLLGSLCPFYRFSLIKNYFNNRF